jgi:hypothetical protein
MRTAPWLLLCHRKSLKYVEARVWHNTNETLPEERMINGIMVLVLAIVVLAILLGDCALRLTY